MYMHMYIYVCVCGGECLRIERRPQVQRRLVGRERTWVLEFSHVGSQVCLFEAVADFHAGHEGVVEVGALVLELSLQLCRKREKKTRHPTEKKDRQTRRRHREKQRLQVLQFVSSFRSPRRKISLGIWEDLSVGASQLVRWNFERLKCKRRTSCFSATEKLRSSSRLCFRLVAD